MRNKGRTSVIDYEGYMSTFDMILSHMVRFWLLTTDKGFNLVGEVWNSGGGDKGHR
jgi:hypothetical protein